MSDWGCPVTPSDWRSRCSIIICTGRPGRRSVRRVLSVVDGLCVGCPAGRCRPWTRYHRNKGVAPRRPGGRAQPAARDPRWSGAVCNDGTPFALEVRDQGSDVWVIPSSQVAIFVRTSGSLVTSERGASHDHAPRDGRAAARRCAGKEYFPETQTKPRVPQRESCRLALLLLGSVVARRDPAGSRHRVQARAGTCRSKQREGGLEYFKTAGLSSTDRCLS